VIPGPPFRIDVNSVHTLGDASDGATT